MYIYIYIYTFLALAVHDDLVPPILLEAPDRGAEPDLQLEAPARAGARAARMAPRLPAALRLPAPCAGSARLRLLALGAVLRLSAIRGARAARSRGVRWAKGGRPRRARRAEAGAHPQAAALRQEADLGIHQRGVQSEGGCSGLG